jgi:hypothetical protein
LVNVSFIESALYSTHLILSARVHEDLALEEKEAQALAEAIAKVAEHYPLVSRGMTPEAAAWMNLFTTAGMIYGPKALPHVIAKVTAPKPPKPGRAPTVNGHPVQ